MNAARESGARAAGHRRTCEHCGRGTADKTVSATRFDDRIVWKCHRCGAAGVQHDQRHNVMMPRPVRTAPPAAPLEWSAHAESIWRRTQGLRGTLGEVYLRYRGCAVPPADSHLRYLPPDGRHGPTLCAAITDARTCRLLSLHFTRLAPDGRGKAGTDRDKLLLRGHRKVGGVIRLFPDEWVTRGLAIAEGVETALAVAHAFTPVWAAIDAGNLAALPLLEGIEALTIFADHDDAGQRAARACAEMWAASNREAFIVTPKAHGLDAADLADAT